MSWPSLSHILSNEDKGVAKPQAVFLSVIWFHMWNQITDYGTRVCCMKTILLWLKMVRDRTEGGKKLLHMTC